MFSGMRSKPFREPQYSETSIGPDGEQGKREEGVARELTAVTGDLRLVTGAWGAF